MPIIQVRSTKQPYIACSNRVTPLGRDILSAWKHHNMPCEIIEYPAGYAGNIAPSHWQEFFSFLINVDESAERAQLAMMGATSNHEASAEIASGTLDIPSELPVGVSVATLKEGAEESYLISAAGIDEPIISIAGLVTHVTQEELRGLTMLLPEAPIRTP